MAGITTIDTICDRVKKLLETYLATELALIDTRNNAVAVDGTGNDFTTHAVHAEDIQTFRDERMGSPMRIVVTPDRIIENNEFQERPVEGLPTTMPRLDRNLRLTVSVRVASNEGNWTMDGARRRCNRVAEAVRVVMDAYGQLSVPGASTPLTALVTDTYFVGDSVPSLVEDESWQFYQRDLSFDVRTIENRA